MTLALVPIPPDCVEQTEGTWLPFVEAIAERSRYHVSQLTGQIDAGLMQVFVIWDADKQRAQAFAGVRFDMRGFERVAELVWMTGENRKEWIHLLDELELYLREHQKCVAIKPICRSGWVSTLKAKGYRITHVLMEKELAS